MKNSATFKKLFLVGIAVLLSLSLITVNPGSAQALTKVKFAFGTPTIQVLMLNIAIGGYLGYYKEEGCTI